jgi:hypothetical protein
MTNHTARPGGPRRVAFLALALTLCLLGVNESPRALAGDQADGYTTADVGPRELAAQCPVIVYARVETNRAPHLVPVVAEVWQGSREAGAGGITNGLRLAAREWSGNGGPLPDGAAVFFERSPGAAAEGLRVRSVWWTWPAGVGNRTALSFKASCGLDGSKAPAQR